MQHSPSSSSLHTDIHTRKNIVSCFATKNKVQRGPFQHIIKIFVFSIGCDTWNETLLNATFVRHESLACPSLMVLAAKYITSAFLATSQIALPHILFHGNEKENVWLIYIVFFLCVCVCVVCEKLSSYKRLFCNETE